MTRSTLIFALAASAAVCAPLCASSSAQTDATPPTTAPTIAPTVAPEKPLPDIPTLMLQVEAHQRADEARVKDYTFRSDNRFEKTDSHGNLKETKTSTSEFFWLHGVQVRRVLKRDGKDLSAEELKKQNEQIDKDVAKAVEKRGKADAANAGTDRQTDSHGNDEITVARVLELGVFSNARRVQVNGRDTIAADYTGDPKAKTHNRAEAAVHDMAGTVWIDEQDAVMQHFEGHFIRDFKIAGGLAASVSQGTSFEGSMTRINDDVWLPATFSAHGHARYLLFFTLDGTIQGRQYDYRRFKATTTMLPGMTAVDDDGGETPSAVPTTPPPPPRQ